MKWRPFFLELILFFLFSVITVYASLPQKDQNGVIVHRPEIPTTVKGWMDNSPIIFWGLIFSVLLMVSGVIPALIPKKKRRHKNKKLSPLKA